MIGKVLQDYRAQSGGNFGMASKIEKDMIGTQGNETGPGEVTKVSTKSTNEKLLFGVTIQKKKTKINNLLSVSFQMKLIISTIKSELQAIQICYKTRGS